MKLILNFFRSLVTLPSGFWVNYSLMDELEKTTIDILYCSSWDLIKKIEELNSELHTVGDKDDLFYYSISLTSLRLNAIALKNILCLIHGGEDYTSSLIQKAIKNEINNYNHFNFPTLKTLEFFVPLSSHKLLSKKGGKTFKTIRLNIDALNDQLAKDVVQIRKYLV